MKSLLLGCFFLLSLTACSDFKPTDNQPANVDSAFYTLLERYKADKLKYLGTAETRNINILFYSQEAPIIGVCNYGNELTILIDPTYWFYSSFSDQITLFYHEMGHCDLGIHNHALTNTIMNKYGISGYIFSTNPDYYLEQLFIYRR